jgi:Lrp/AsnC family transcriptional regulator, leucine-responsive regulatory protein
VADDSAVLDRIDRDILRILRDDGRIGWSELGARVHLSPNAAAERVRRLVRSGVVRRFTAEIDPAALGRTLEAVIDVRVAWDGLERFTEGIVDFEEVTWIAHVTGRTDFQVHVACDGTQGLNTLLTRFRDELGATETLTTVVLERIR